MPVIEGPATQRHRLVRNIRVVRGSMRFAIEIEPRFDYGRQPHTVEVSDHGAVFRSDGLELTVHGIVPEGSSVRDLGITVRPDQGGLRWTPRANPAGWCWSRWAVPPGADRQRRGRPAPA